MLKLKTDPSAGPVTHRGIICDGCGASPITGIRFKCSVCPDFVSPLLLLAAVRTLLCARILY